MFWKREERVVETDDYYVINLVMFHEMCLSNFFTIIQNNSLKMSRGEKGEEKQLILIISL